MMVRYAQLTNIQVIPYKRVIASFTNIKNAGKIVSQINENYLYFSCTGLRGDVPNDNGDMFPWDELTKRHITGVYVWETWIGKEVLENHDPKRIRGSIIDTYPYPKIKSVEMLNSIDKTKYADLAEGIESGKITDTSMGVLCSFGKCSVCGNIAYEEDQWCEHMKYMKGKRDINTGDMIYEINYDLTGLENSIITYGRGAEPMAKIHKIVAQRTGLNDEQTDRLIMAEFTRFCQEKFGVSGEDFLVYLLERLGIE
ncbi:MAG TPA: hypothetical protein P5513_06060 [Candidatus Diapherotrites archaeon]|nr:hypothetical protein [Candidatus Diapherotrites archaeon]